MTLEESQKLKPSQTTAPYVPKTQGKIYPPSSGNLANPTGGPVPIPKGAEAPLGSNSPVLAPGQKDAKGVVTAMPPPPPPMYPPVGTIRTTASKAVPSGYVDCKETKAADFCKTMAQQSGADVQYMVKLPEDGSLDDLNTFLDAAARQREERQQ